MNYTNMIDSCQAHLLVQYAPNTERIRQKWLTASNIRIARVKQASCLLVQAGCSAFPFYTPTKPLKRLCFKYKTVIVLKLKLIFIFRYL